MTEAITQEQMQKLVRSFVSFGAPDILDGVGPNKPDWPFFSALAHQEEIQVWQYLEAGERLYKYRRTQLPSITKRAGLDPDTDWEKLLIEVKAMGELALVKKKEHDNLLSKVKHTGCVKSLQALTDSHGYTAEEAEAIMQEFKQKKENQRQAEMLRNTVDAKMVTDRWKTKWGKMIETPRVGLIYSYNPELNNALKRALPFPEVKWDGNIKMWTLKNEKSVIAKAMKVIEDSGKYVSETLQSFHDNLGEEVKTTKRQDKTVTAYLLKGVVYLKWPFLADVNERTSLLNIVKATDGRKFDADKKEWKISLAQVGDLCDRLKRFIDLGLGTDSISGPTEASKIAQQLIDSMNKIPEVLTYMEKRAERIAISGASKLSDEDAYESMKKRFSKIFPEGLELYPFQYVGVRFAELSGGRCLIGDDMGIGKTIQAIGYCALHPEQWPVLVVCPANVKYNWLNEFRKWMPSVYTDVVANGKSPVPSADVVVINYDLMAKKKDELLEKGFNIVVCDESHYLKNKGTKSKPIQRTVSTLEVAEASEAVLCLSGTAITNRPKEFFTTLNLLQPAEFGNFFTYGKRYCNGHEQYIGRGRYVWNFDGASNTDELHLRIRDFAIRRLKKEVLEELPDKVRSIISVEPSQAERKAYQDVHDSWLDRYHDYLERGSMPAGFVLNMLTDLRHHCGLMKVNATVEWAREYWTQNPDNPLIIFTHHKDVMSNLMEAFASAKDWPVKIKGSHISGEVSAEGRTKVVERFQNGELNLLICSTIAAKEGLTLTAADTVIFVEREWVPGWEEQAEDRVNRIGQDSDTVWANYLSVKGTIDEKFDMVVEEKRKVVKAVLDGGTIDERDGIANALIKSMIEAGDLPESFKTAMKKSKQKPKDVIA